MTTPKTATTVLIHGYGFDHRLWYPVELAFEGHHIIYLSLPGFALEPVTEEYTIAALSEKYWQHLQQVTDGPVHLAGHSMGGYVCMEMAAQHPGKVASVTLIHSHVFADDDSKKQSRNETITNIRTNGRKAFLEKLIPAVFTDQNQSQAIIQKWIERGLAYDENAWAFGTQAMRDRRDHTDTLKKLDKPVLLIAGEGDKLMKSDLAYQQAAMAASVTLHVYPDTGHMAMYENTQTLINDLVAFYQTIE